MWRYVFRRLLVAIPTLLVIITLAFFMVRFAPGGPFDLERTLPPEIQANLNAMYHLDEPLWQQYLRYMGSILRGDFGPSFQYTDRTVNELIGYGFPVSMKLGFTAIAIAVVVGSFLGIIAAIKQNSKIDYTVMSAAMTGITIPNFVVAPLLQLFLVVLPFTWWGLKILPSGGWGNSWKQMILPVIALVLPQIAYVSRLMRGSMIEVLRANHVRTARAKGLSEKAVIIRHCLKPALMPIVSYLGPACAAMLTGSVVIEQIFGIPGIGRYFVQGALNRDYTLVLGVVVFYGVLIVLFNLLVDLAYAWLDPKVRLS
ncbi:oligopeptide ABC transporter permease OppB [Suttonella ornithocola]|uniref:Oligopeptide transport system permease protein oppB n=1 Tax=Suttonella ornithocola TaxID=279832 RepID=A0A380MX35_9GAMM|nr:oligopeptide ABC transporter permease OppB [Suttonella ornithocola]SUO96463.1 Oligopeptide transport system permease protein oppB [Suttonella ornithocola]